MPNEPNQKRAIVWVAVSTKPQASEDKSSLAVQESDARAWCEANGYQVVDVLRVPGHSRFTRDIHELNSAMKKKGIDALDKLLQYVNTRGFDVLVCRDAERFARKPSLLIRIIEEVIESAGAKIYSTQDGYIDETNHLAWSMMAGFKTGSDAKRRVKGAQDGQRRRSERGLPRRIPPLSHTYVWDTTGPKPKPVRMIVDESKRPLLDALRDIVLAGTPYGHISEALMEAGFRLPRNTQMPDYWRIFLHNALVWGHTIERDSKLTQTKHLYGRYCFNPSVEPPQGITLRYNTHDPAWTGEDARRIQHELMYQRQSSTGRARPRSRHRFSLLLVCAECGHALAYHANPGGRNPSYQCRYMDNAKLDRTPDCTNTKAIRQHDAQQRIDRILRDFVDAADPNAFFRPFYGETLDIPARITALEDLLSKARKSARYIIDKQAGDPALASVYDDSLKEISAEIAGLQQQINTLKTRTDIVPLIDRRPIADELRTLLREGSLWTQSDLDINRLLTRFLAGLRFVVRNGQIVRLIPDPRPPVGRKRKLGN